MTDLDVYSLTLFLNRCMFYTFFFFFKKERETIKTLFYSRYALELLDDVMVQKSYQRCVFHFTLRPAWGKTTEGNRFFILNQTTWRA